MEKDKCIGVHIFTSFLILFLFLFLFVAFCSAFFFALFLINSILFMMIYRGIMRSPFVHNSSHYAQLAISLTDHNYPISSSDPIETFTVLPNTPLSYMLLINYFRAFSLNETFSYSTYYRSLFFVRDMYIIPFSFSFHFISFHSKIR